MTKYVAIVVVDGMEMFVIDGNEPKIRVFEDKELAEQVARILGPNFTILTLDEFEQKYVKKEETNGA